MADSEREIDYDAAMKLPVGKTCADCVHVRRCTLFGFTEATDTSCDFFPSRWRPAAPPKTETGRT